MIRMHHGRFDVRSTTKTTQKFKNVDKIRLCKNTVFKFDKVIFTK